MKLIIFILICLYSAYGHASSNNLNKCNNTANSFSSAHFTENVGRQIDASSLSGYERQNAIIRNLCFAATNKLVFLRYSGECLNAKDSDIVIYGLNLKEIREYSLVDCFDCDISLAKEIVTKIEGAVYDIFLPNINNINSQILSGNVPENLLGTIDASPSVCWDSDSNGDNIWHALVRSNLSVDNIASMCASVDITKVQDAFYVSTIYSINNNGESPVLEAIKTNHMSLIKWLKMLLHDDRKTCVTIANEIYSQSHNEIELKDIKNILGC